MMDNQSNNKDKIKLHEYGRILQQLCEMASRRDSDEYQSLLSDRLIQVMNSLGISDKKTGNNEAKLMADLARLTDNKWGDASAVNWDEIIAESAKQPLPYPQHSIKMRHHGFVLEKLVQQLAMLSDEADKEQVAQSLKSVLRKNIRTTIANGDIDERIAHELNILSIDNKE